MENKMNKLMLVGGAVILAASILFTAARNSEFDAGYEIYRTTASDTITDTEADTITISPLLYSFWKYNHTVKGVQESGTIDLTLTVQESNALSGDEWYTVATDSVDADGEITSVTGDNYGVRQRLIITGTGTQSAIYTHRITLKKPY
jgi:hypothetical protein